MNELVAALAAIKRARKIIRELGLADPTLQPILNEIDIPLAKVDK